MKYEYVKELREAWDEYIDSRSAYSFGDEEIDTEDYKALVKKTFDVIKQAKEDYLYRNRLPEDINATMEYLDLLSKVSQFTFYDNMEDESENRVFTAVCLVAQGLRDFAVCPDAFEITQNGSRYYIPDETAAGNLYLYRDSYPYIDDEITDEELEKVYCYNVYDGDLTEFLELANSLT